MKKILAYFLLGITFLGYAFFRKYTGSAFASPSFFYLLGILFVVCAFLLLRSNRSSSEIKSRKRLGKTIAELKANGDRISVDFSQCEIKENNYLAELEKNNYGSLPSRIFEGFAMLLTKNDNLNLHQTEVEQSVIVYHHQNTKTGINEKFISPIIPKDKITISIYLDQQKRTFLYIDKTDRTKYYFDLDFLFN